MDSVTKARDILAHFRIKELKEVLSQLGLVKQGKKQDLVDRISSLLSDEKGTCSFGVGAVVNVIDDTYRKMQYSGATDLVSRSHSSPDLNCMKPKVEVDDACGLDMKVRCPCGSSLITDSMIKCEDHECQVWQHLGCVMISEKPMEGSGSEPPLFYCEVCRLSRADPFLVTVGHPVLPLKLTHNTSADRTKLTQHVEKSFTLSRADRELLERTDYDLQVWCILLNDQVYYRMHWLQYSELLVNGVQIRTTDRPGEQLLGINGRDDGPLLKTLAREGVNEISLSGCDDRVFCFGIRLVKTRTVQQILNMVLRESEGESLEDALARICRCVGGNARENTESDSDIEVITDSVRVNLRCPMSGSRMRIAGRFKACVHMGCFDLETFIELNQRSRKWQCPTCFKNYSLESIIIDPYFNRITSLMRNCGEDVNEIDVRHDGSWRAKNEGEFSDNDLCYWHLIDGSLCTIANGGKKTNCEMSRQFKQVGVSEGHTGLKFDLNRIGNDKLEVSKTDNTDQAFIFANIMTRTPPKDASIIFLSDSDEGDMPTSETIYNTVPNPCCSGMTSSTNDPIFPADLGLSTSGTSSFGFLNCSISDFGFPLWEMQSSPTEYQLFHSDVNVPDVLTDAQGSLARTPTNAEMEGSLVDNPLAFGSNDPSLQNFLPTRPDSESLHTGMREHSKIPNDVHADDWISLTLASGGAQTDASITRVTNSRNQILPSRNGPMN